MKIITSHERADMDALASMYAASLLYPDHQVVLPLKLNRNLRDFVALYRDILPFVSRRDLPRGRITHVVLVDTQAIAPLRGMDANTQIHIIDHHRPEGTLSEHVIFEGDPVGATTSLLVEKLQEQQIAVDTIGASLLLMGIYEDTGALTYGTTTHRDAQAAAWLMQQGADLSLVDTFLHHPLSNGQREALAELIGHSAIETIKGRTVCFASIRLENYIDELSSLVHQIIDVYEPEVCFLLAEHEHSVQIIARSVTDAVDVGYLLRDLGGGGHSKAAAALVSETTLEEVLGRLRQAVERHAKPPILVREIMSTNVHTLDVRISVRDAAQLMRRYGHEGFPVVDQERLVGIVTRSDVDRSLHHRLGDMPVRNILHTGPLHVKPSDPVDEVQRVMIEHGLGQVPVVEDGRFVGIVTRTDLIKLWTPTRNHSRADELRRLLAEALPEALRALLLRARDVANDLGYSLYIVGGFVRDLLLGSPTLDLDLVVEGDAIHLARTLAPQVGGRVRSHARFGTAKVILPKGDLPDIPPALDFVTARTEFYEQPSVLPSVERSSIKQDLYRRDFTINTLAICLDRDRYGELLDFYGGERDIRQKSIRVLHNLSFVEDPTRILRAVRFEQRLGFTIEERTAELINDAMELLEDVTGERLRNELYLALREAQPELIFDRLARLGILQHLHPSLRFGHELAQLFVRLRERFHDWPAREGEAGTGDAGSRADALALCYLAVLTSPMNPSELESFVRRFRIAGHDASFLQEVGRLREFTASLIAQAMLPSTIYRLLNPISREARFVLSVVTDSPIVRQRLELYERELAQIAPSIDGHFLRALGIPPGPIYREILDRVGDALRDGLIRPGQEEEELARRLAAAAHAAHHGEEAGDPPVSPRSKRGA